MARQPRGTASARGTRDGRRKRTAKSAVPSSDGDAPLINGRTGTLVSKKPEPEADEEEYEVEQILNHQAFNGIDFYLVKWKGYPHVDNLWLQKSNMACDAKIEEFDRTHTPNKADMSAMYTIIAPATIHPSLSVVNTVDDVCSVEDFTYINENKFSKNVPVPDDPLFPCQCEDSCVEGCPCLEQRYYDKDGRVQVETSEPIFECSERCGCGPECSSRVVQRGSMIQFEIFRALYKGWGIRTKQKVRQGTYIAEYVGEIIDYDEAEKRGIEDRKKGNTYLFDLDSDCNDDESADFSIDARRFGNISRFFNHSCDPNLAIWSAYIEHRDPRLPRLVFFATRDIEADEELTLDYNPGKQSEGRLDSPCYCGAKTCRQQIFM